MLDDSELGEHRENIAQAKLCLRDFRDSYKLSAEPEAPDIPKKS
jgi:hypothetical protein